MTTAGGNIAAELIASFEERRDVAAVIDVRGSVATYGDLLDEIARGRSRIATADLAPSSNVIVQAPKGIPFASATLALGAEGHTTVGIEMAQGDAVYIDRADFIDADAVISTGQVRTLQRSRRVRRGLAAMGIELPPPLDLPTIDWDEHTPMAPRVNGAGASAEETRAENIALVVFTGGTTARPKGVQLSHRAVRYYLAGLNQLPEWPCVSSVVADHPQQVLYGLAHGKTVYLSPARARRRAQHIAELLFEQGVDCYFGSPVMWDDILDCGVHRSAAVEPQAVLLGGAPVTQSMLERLERELSSSVSIRCLYGMSESGLIAHISAPAKLAQLRDTDPADLADPADPVGQVVEGVTVRVASDGELLVSSPSRFSGYVGEPRQALGEPFPTGDIGRLDDTGLSLLGRKKNMIVQQGVNLYPEQFEARLLQQHAGSQRAFDEVALVAGPPDHRGDEHFVLAYVAASTDETAALKLCAPVFPRGHAPSAAVRLPSLPRTGRQNKVDRQALAKLVGARTLRGLQDDLFDRLLGELPRRSAARRRAMAMRTLARRNLTKVQQLDAALRPSEPSLVDPVFILGHQRSGTTLLHHALASSPEATALTLSDMLLPHPGGWRLAKSIAPMMHRLHRVATRSRRWRDALTRHDLDPAAPEEEEWLFAALGLSGFLPSAFDETLGSGRFDDIRYRSMWDEATRRILIDTYATVVGEWHRRRHDRTPLRHIAKNPAFGPLASDLLRAFPTARFIVALRDPHDAILSRLALISAIHDRPLTPPETTVIVQDSVHQLNGLAEQLQLVPADRVHLVFFPRLMSDPEAMVNEVCRFADLEPPATLPAVRVSTPAPAPAGVPSRLDLAAPLSEFMCLFESGELT